MNKSVVALIRSTEVLTKSVVALIRIIEVLNKSVVALIRSTEVLTRSAVALITSTEVLNKSVVALIRDVPTHVVTEVPCHFIPGLRHSYDYMYLETSYLIIGDELCLDGEVRYIFHLLLSYLNPC